MEQGKGAAESGVKTRSELTNNIVADVESGGGVVPLFGAGISVSAGIPVLRDVSLTVAPGTSTVIIGGSGTGKSVTLKCILGL
ncbi:MAG: ATP-binding cassette domain-containing protein, partial [Planctomycetota bacterium]